ncbi:MAG: nucleotidyltransferase family protein, partial [Pseudomonas sp.]
MREHRTTVQTLISSDPLRWHLLAVVRSLALPDCWIGAGFVR